MTHHVILYLCEAQFTGGGTVTYEQAPEIGSLHDCILFVSQETQEPDYAAVGDRLSKHGWSLTEIRRFGPFQPESINSQQMRVFERHYEESLEHGDSLVWYA